MVKKKMTLPPNGSTKTLLLNKEPALKPVEQTMFIVMREPLFWHLVDEFFGSTRQSSSMEMSLRRRGFTVRKVRHSKRKDVVQVWARWDHDVPTEAHPWPRAENNAYNENLPKGK